MQGFQSGHKVMSKVSWSRKKEGRHSSWGIFQKSRKERRVHNGSSRGMEKTGIAEEEYIGPGK